MKVLENEYAAASKLQVASRSVQLVVNSASGQS